MGFGTAYLSITLLSASNGSTTDLDPFDEGNHAAFSQKVNEPAVGITYTPADGRFTVDNDGKYKVGVSPNLVGAGNGTATEYKIRVNDTDEYIVTAGVNNLTDPDLRKVGSTLELSADDYFNFLFDNNGNFVVNAEPGTTMTIVQVAD